MWKMVRCGLTIMTSELDWEFFKREMLRRHQVVVGDEHHPTHFAPKKGAHHAKPKSS